MSQSRRGLVETSFRRTWRVVCQRETDSRWRVELLQDHQQDIQVEPLQWILLLFGFDGLVQAVREEVDRDGTSLADAASAIVERARAFAGGRINDDVCLLLTRCMTATM